MASLRLILRLLAAAFVLATTAYWFAAGAHRGWSMDKVPVSQVDEITGLDYTTYEDRFVPGLELLAGGIAVGLVLFSTTLFLRPSGRGNKA